MAGSDPEPVSDDYIFLVWASIQGNALFLFISNSSAINASALLQGGMQMQANAVISHSFEIVSAWIYLKFSFEIVSTRTPLQNRSQRESLDQALGGFHTHKNAHTHKHTHVCTRTHSTHMFVHTHRHVVHTHT